MAIACVMVPCCAGFQTTDPRCCTPCQPRRCCHQPPHCRQHHRQHCAARPCRQAASGGLVQLTPAQPQVQARHGRHVTTSGLGLTVATGAMQATINRDSYGHCCQLGIPMQPSLPPPDATPQPPPHTHLMRSFSARCRSGVLDCSLAAVPISGYCERGGRQAGS